MALSVALLRKALPAVITHGRLQPREGPAACVVARERRKICANGPRGGGRGTAAGLEAAASGKLLAALAAASAPPLTLTGAARQLGSRAPRPTAWPPVG